jgi:hypothetical protein
MLSSTNDALRGLMKTNAATWDDESKTLLTVTRGSDGWNVKEVRDSQVVREVRMSDWHRVERILRIGHLPNALQLT